MLLQRAPLDSQPTSSFGAIDAVVVPPFSANVAERNQVSGPIARASRRENAPAD
jgi:hypothetical protein